MGGMICCVDSRKNEAEMNLQEEGSARKGIAHFIKHNPDSVNEYIFGARMLDLDYETPEFPDDYKNKYEFDVTLKKKELVELFERISSRDPANGKWDTKIDTDDLKIYMKQKGTELTKDHPVVLSEMIFPANLQLESIMRAIHNPEARMAWDKDILSGEIKNIIDEKMLIWYQVNKSAISIVQERDFLEKKLKFTHNNVQYIFLSSIPDTFKPEEGKISRAYTVTTFHVFHQLDDGRVLFTGINQNDLNLTGAAKLGAAVAMKQVPKNVQQWQEKLIQYLSQISEMPNLDKGKEGPQ